MATLTVFQGLAQQAPSTRRIRNLSITCNWRDTQQIEDIGFVKSVDPCLLILAAFAIILRRSSGTCRSRPCSWMRLITLFPVRTFTNGTPYWSRRIIPIIDGELPAFASSTTLFSTHSAFFSLSIHSGTRRVEGRLLPDWPFRLVCILAIENTSKV